jgi:hypothetical protein
MKALISRAICVSVLAAGLAVTPAASSRAQNGSSAPTVAAGGQAGQPTESTAWIGLRFRPVPEPLAQQLGLIDDQGGLSRGMMVVNVVRHGPADVAGLRRYDVITTIAEKPAATQPQAFIEQLAAFEPGQRLRLTVLRRAKPMALTLTVGRNEPAAHARYEYKYDEQARGVYQETTGFRGAVIRKQGEQWVLRDFQRADPQLFNELPPDVRDRVVRWANAVEPSNRTSIVHDGWTIEIMRDAEGMVTVRKSSRDEAGLEKAVTRTYRNPEELRDADPVAYKLHRQISGDPVLGENDEPVRAMASPDRSVVEEAGIEEPGVDADPLGELDLNLPEVYLPRDGEAADPDALLRALSDAEAYHDQIRNYELFLAEYTGYLRQRLARAEEGEVESMPALWKDLLDRANKLQLGPEREFSVNEAGRIEVRIRKADGDLVMTFADEREMQQNYPALYEQYRELVAGARR